jgi:hypothetical protein
METSLMSESVVDTGDVEETVTQVLKHFVQGGGEYAAMSVQLVQDQVEIDLGYDQGSLSKWHNFLGRTLSDFFSAAGPIFLFFRATGPIFFDFFGVTGTIFCFSPVTVSLSTNCESVSGPKSSELLTYLLV